MNRIIMGVGGVGGALVNEISRRIREKATEDERKDKEFIVFDSNDEDLKKLEYIQEKYKIKLSTGERSVMEHYASFLKDVYYRADGAGAGFQRIYGRALYLFNKDRIIGAVEAAKSEFKSRTPSDDDFLIIIMNSLGGGTGSSMPMDIALDARTVMGSKATIIGIGILPAKNEAAGHRANAFGAMKELHYILNSKDNEIEGKDYSNPYYMYFLLGREGGGATIDSEIREALSHILIDLGFIPVKIFETKGKWLDMSDITTHAMESGGMNKFSTIGYYEARFPVDELLLYYDLKDKIPEYSEKIGEISANLTDISGKIKPMEDELDELKEDMNSIKKSIKDMTEDSMLERKSRKLRGAEDHAEAIERTINDTRSEIKNLFNEKDALERVLRKTKEIKAHLEANKTGIHTMLTDPKNTRILHIVPLTKEDINYLEGSRANLSETNFKDIMKKLNKESEYIAITHKILPSILKNSLINYSLMKEQYKPKVFELLSNAGFDFLKRADDDIINRDNMLGDILVVISTANDNIVNAQLDETGFINQRRGKVAKNMDVKRVEPKTGPHSFAIYSFLLGIHPWAPSRGKKPQLSELTWTGEAYKNTSDVEVRHSFMYGASTVFKKLTGTVILQEDPDSRREAVTKFWKQYEIIDETVLWNQMPLAIAESDIRVEEIGEELEKLNTKISSVTLPDAYKNPNAFAPAQLRALSENLEGFESDVIKLGDSLRSFKDEFASLKKEISQMTKFFEEASTTGNEESMVNLVQQYNKNLSGIRNQLDAISETYEASFGTYLKDAENFVSNIPAEKQTSQFIIDTIVAAQREIGLLKERWTQVKLDLPDLDVTIADLSRTLETMTNVIKSKV